MIKEALTYSDVLLIPQYSDIKSRTEVDLNSFLGDIEFENPIIASPMDTISEAHMGSVMSDLGGLAIVHRYNSIEEQFNIVADISNGGLHTAAAAIGTSGDYLERAAALVANGATILCVDVAHGHHILMREALRALRVTFGNKVHIMAGNVATLEGYNDLVDWGADSVRCNIGGGCFTPGTSVRGPGGDTPIEDIKIGDKVFSHTGEIREVVDTLTFVRDEEIMVINGIESTKNHEYYVVDIQDADKVNDNNLDTFAYWLEAEHLDMNKHLLVELG